MTGRDRTEDVIYGCAVTLFAVAIAIGVVVLLSGHGYVTDSPAHRVSPTGVTATTGGVVASSK